MTPDAMNGTKWKRTDTHKISGLTDTSAGVILLSGDLKQNRPVSSEDEMSARWTSVILCLKGAECSLPEFMMNIK